MELKEYFENTKGTSVFATADKDGKVNTAIFSRPHCLEDGTIAFIMLDKLNHHNLQSNPYASYLFIEDGEGYKGKRLYLKKIREEKDTELLKSLLRKKYPKEESKYLVFFSLEKELPLIGDGK